jgi:hypothetical protein
MRPSQLKRDPVSTMNKCQLARHSRFLERLRLRFDSYSPACSEFAPFRPFRWPAVKV